MPMPLKLIPIGTVFGTLTVLKHVGKGFWECACICGNTCLRNGHELRRSKLVSCGCQRRASQARGKTTHGMSGTPEHRAWKNLINRCENTNCDHFEWYGKKGIKVCARWRHSFENFYADMGPRPSALHSIEREDLDKDYAPDNCVWATSDVQSRNRSDNRWIEFRGERKVLNDWETSTGLGRGVIRRRLEKGWSVERALTEPVQYVERWHGKDAL